MAAEARAAALTAAAEDTRGELDAAVRALIPEWISEWGGGDGRGALSAFGAQVRRGEAAAVALAAAERSTVELAAAAVREVGVRPPRAVD